MTYPSSKTNMDNSTSGVMEGLAECAMNQTYPRKHFLDIPGEIRNKIYSFAVEPKPVKLIAALQWMDPIDNTQCRTKDHREYFSLTQVCRKIRTEFLPLYMQSTEVWLDIEDVSKYLGTILPQDPAQLQEYKAHITIEMSSVLRLDEGVDILPLVELSMMVPGLSLLFGADDDGARDEYRSTAEEINEKILDLENPSWKHYLKTGIQKVVVQRDCGWGPTHPLLHVVFHESKIVKVNGEVLDLPNRQDKSLFKAFLAEVGLEELMFWSVQIGPHYKARALQYQPGPNRMVHGTHPFSLMFCVPRSAQN